jgi:hypothetical protein
MKDANEKCRGRELKMLTGKQGGQQMTMTGSEYDFLPKRDRG